MDPIAVALIVAAAVGHATWNLYAKRASDGGAAFVWLNCAASTVIFAPVAVATVVFATPEWSLWLPLAICGSTVAHLGYFLTLQHGYRHGDYSIVYPLARGTGPALSVTFAIVFLGERPGWLGLMGTVAIIGGILIIGLGRAGGDTRVATGVGYGVFTGVVIATYTLWDSWAVGPLAISPLLYDWCNNALRMLLLGPYALTHRAQVGDVWRRHRVPVLVVGVLGPAAYLCVLFAYRYAPVSLVAPAREFSIVIGSLLAWWLLREPQAERRILGATVVFAGVVALAVK